MLQIPCKMTGFTKCCRGIDHVKGEKSVRHAAAVCHMKASMRHTHTNSLLPTSKNQSENTMPNGHPAFFTNFRYGKLQHVANKIFQFEHGKQIRRKYRFQFKNAATTMQSKDSRFKTLQIPCKQAIQGPQCCQYRGNKRCLGPCKTTEIRDFSYNDANTMN